VRTREGRLIACAIGRFRRGSVSGIMVIRVIGVIRVVVIASRVIAIVGISGQGVVRAIDIAS